MIFSAIWELKFKIFPFIAHHGATPQSHWAKKTVKKQNLWGKRAVTKVLGWKPATIKSYKKFGNVLGNSKRSDHVFS